MTFPKDFLWGASTSAYQVEGATDVDGRGISIWETFEQKPGAVANSDTGKVACDHYNLFSKDISLMSEIGLNAYRFSFSWPRLFPDGTGRRENRGFDFYDRLIDELLENNIEPVATLYHWDLPQKLQDHGGWASREILEPFVEYSSTIAEYFGDRIKRFSPINEPWVVAWLGYGTATLAPGIADRSQAIAASHHTVVAHRLSLETIKSIRPNALVGPVLNQINPDLDDWSDPFQLEAAKIYDEFLNLFWMDGIFKGHYSENIWNMYGADLEKVVRAGDLMPTKNDWLGINYYFNMRIGHEVSHKHPTANPFFSLLWDKNSENAAVGPTTDMGWPITPYGLGDLTLRWNREYPNLVPEIFITENGCAYNDEPNENGRVTDTRRIEYLKSHLKSLQSAIARGAKVGGYFHWSLLDNFEWALGYEKRFGLIHVNYETQTRTLKDSALYYRDVIKTNGANLN